MSQLAQTYVTSPRGKLRVWCGVFLLGIPILFVLALLLDSEAREAVVAGSVRPLTLVLLCLLVAVSIAAGIYFTLFERLVGVDLERGHVTVTVRVFGVSLHRRVWRLTEFQKIEMRHGHYGEGPSDIFQSNVGIRHSSGFVLWLRGFWSHSTEPSSEALAFLQELSESTGLPYDRHVT